MSYSEPTRTAARRTRLPASSSSLAVRRGLGKAHGAVPDPVTVFDDETPAVANLDPDLLGALRRAATDAADDGVEFFVNGGWRSTEYHEQLRHEAVSKYGSEEEAARWVATPGTSHHAADDPGGDRQEHRNRTGADSFPDHAVVKADGYGHGAITVARALGAWIGWRRDLLSADGVAPGDRTTDYATVGGVRRGGPVRAGCRTR